MWNIIADIGYTDGTVIYFAPESGRCGEEYVGAVAIIKRESDTIRVILNCYAYSLDSGEYVHIKIFPPVDTDMEIPGCKRLATPEECDNTTKYRYDKTILKTVFGRIL